MSEAKPAAIRTPGELAEEIRGLSDADWLRLRKVAAARAHGRPIDANDLLQEALLRALDGGRKCPTHVDAVRFLAEAMRSIAHGEQEKAGNQQPLMLIASHGVAEPAVDPPNPGLDPEQNLASAQEVAAIKPAMLGLFEDDPTAQIILEGLMEGMEGEELRALTELDKIAYESKRRLIRRRIDKKFPQGWMS